MNDGTLKSIAPAASAVAAILAIGVTIGGAMVYTHALSSQLDSARSELDVVSTKLAAVSIDGGHINIDANVRARQFELNNGHGRLSPQGEGAVLFLTGGLNDEYALNLYANENEIEMRRTHTGGVPGVPPQLFLKYSKGGSVDKQWKDSTGH